MVKRKKEDLQWRPHEYEWKKPEVEWQPPEYERKKPDVEWRPPEYDREKPDVEWRPPEYWIVRPTTQLARLSIDQLDKANPLVVREAIQAISPKTSAAALMDYLERKVKIEEVLNLNAEKWSDDTKQDFASAFQMGPTKLEKDKQDAIKKITNTMDAIVSIAILNDPDLEDEIRMENTPDVTESDYKENRPIIWQYPEPGPLVEPPQIIIVAVEHRDVAEAEEIVQSIMGKLVEHNNFKIPKGISLKLKKYK